MPFWLQRISLLRWFNLSTVSFPSCAYPYPSVLAVSPGEASRCSAFMPASRIDDQSLPRGMCVNPSPGVVGIAPTPETSSQAIESFLLCTWGPILRTERSVSGQRIALRPYYWSVPPHAVPETPRASPSRATSGGQTARPHRAGHDTGRSICRAGRTRHATRPQWVGPWPYDTDVAAPRAPKSHTPRGRGCVAPLSRVLYGSNGPSRFAGESPRFDRRPSHR